jgi:hypothetical protein
MVPTVASEKFPSGTTGVDPETLGLVAQCLNHYSTPDPSVNLTLCIYVAAQHGRQCESVSNSRYSYRR